MFATRTIVKEKGLMMVKAGIKDFNTKQQHIFNQSNNQKFGWGTASSYLMQIAIRAKA